MSIWSRKARPRVLSAALVLLAALALAGCGGSLKSAAHNYYLALGDSLSVGIQPNAKGQQLETDKGYVNDIYATLTRRISRLKLVEMGCPGDATPQVLTGQGNVAAARSYHCDRTGGSQLKAALAFIRAHRSQVKLISIDIGANDLNFCVSAAGLSKGLGYIASCVSVVEQMIATNLPKILAPLHAAAAPGTRLVAGEIYDPFLVGLLSSDPVFRTVAEQSVSIVDRINAEIASAADQSGFRTADLTAIFETDNRTPVDAPKLGGDVPRNLLVLCAFTYLCTKKPQGPNIHPDAAGYRAIAKAYEQQVGRVGGP
jgi:lysophospholipase L1-like esterase